MIFICEVFYPFECTDEIVKRISDLPPLPDSIILKGPYARFISKKRIKSLSIYEFEDSEFLNAFEFIVRRLSSCENIDGFSYNIRIWHEEHELLST